MFFFKIIIVVNTIFLWTSSCYKTWMEKNDQIKLSIIFILLLLLMFFIELIQAFDISSLSDANDWLRALIKSVLLLSLKIKLLSSFNKSYEEPTESEDITGSPQHKDSFTVKPQFSSFEGITKKWEIYCTYKNVFNI